MLLSLVAIVVALVVADGQVRQRMDQPGPLRTAIGGLRLDPARKHVVVMGTCLSGQHISKWSVEQGLGQGWQLENLGAAASTPVEWYLAWRNLLPRDRIDVLLLAYGRFDLSQPLNPYETELLDLATPQDMGELADLVCDSLECRLSLRLQAASALVRYRTVLAGQLWHRLGMKQQDTELARQRVVDGLPTDRHESWDGQDPAWVYLERLLSEARAAGVTAVLQPLPLRPDQPDRRQSEARDSHDRAVAEVAARTGAVLLEARPLPAEAFEDDVHLLKEPMEDFSRDLGSRLAALATSGSAAGTQGEQAQQGD